MCDLQSQGLLQTSAQTIEESKIYGKGWCYKFTNYGRRRTFPFKFFTFIEL